MNGSLTATISISSCSMAFRKTIRPIRPKPLIPTLVGAMILAGGMLVGEEIVVRRPRSGKLCRELQCPREGARILLRMLRKDGEDLP